MHVTLCAPPGDDNDEVTRRVWKVQIPMYQICAKQIRKSA